MRILLSRKALRDYQRLTKESQKAADKQLSLLLRDIRYPSLHAKKYDEARGIWQIRVSGGYRLYFQIKGDLYRIIAIIKHPK